MCSPDDLFNEVSELKSMFYQNGYPHSLFEEVLHKLLNPEMSKDKEECVVFKVPFVGDHSYSFGKKKK